LPILARADYKQPGSSSSSRQISPEIRPLNIEASIPRKAMTSIASRKRRLRPLTEDPPAVTESKIDFAGRTNPISLGNPTFLRSSFRNLENL
jgi:hypothetical protein